jgi:hypothetical protein
MTAAWWVLAGLFAWLLAGLALGLWLGPLLKRRRIEGERRAGPRG